MSKKDFLEGLPLELDEMSLEERSELLVLLDEYSERQKYNKIQQVFPDEGPLSYKHYPKHLNFIKGGAKYKERIMFGGNRTGKAQPIDELVVTPEGYRPIGDIQPGDYVVGSDGAPTKVLAVHPQGLRENYEVSFTDGSTVRCDKDHLWTLSYSGRDSFQTKSASQWSKIEKSKYVPQRPKVEFSEKQVLIEPYLLGLLIGDGGLSNNCIKFTTADSELVEYCKATAPTYDCKFTHYEGYNYGFTSQIRCSKGYGYNELLSRIREYQLDTTSHYKHIPLDYLHGSIRQRTELLQGLMDTDGYICKFGKGYYNTVSKRLAYDVLFLTRSLGINSRYKEKQVGYEIYIPYADFPIARLTRKVSRQLKIDNAHKVSVKEFREIGLKESVCITVAAKDSLYLTKDFILTHNSELGSFELACHLTGIYPHWWEGRRFDKPIKAWAMGSTGYVTRDIVQTKLLGRLGNIGTGMIPRSQLADGKSTSSKPGVPGAVLDVFVKHVSGGISHVVFKSFDQGVDSFMGDEIDVVWMDEEPPYDVYAECLMRTLTSKGMLYCTFTPLKGFSDVVLSFLPNKKFPSGNEVVTDTGAKKFLERVEWDEVPHLDQDEKDAIRASLKPHELEAKTKGIPTIGEGKVYCEIESNFVIPPFEIPSYWPRIVGMDVGWKCTAAIAVARDPHTDKYYVYDEYYQGQKLPEVHAAAISRKGKWIPIAIDPASNAGSQRDGQSLFDEYSQYGLQLINADNTLETGITRIANFLGTDRLKVFNTCRNLLSEFRTYERDDSGKIKGKRQGRANDHALDALRYAMMSSPQEMRSPPDITDKRKRHMKKRLQDSTRNPVTGY